MLRKLMLAMFAAMSFITAPAPGRAADLDGWHTRYRGAWGPRFYNGVPVSYGYGLCYQQVLLQTPWGPRWRLVNQCW